MKKLTIKEYADLLREEYPNKTKGLSDIQIVSSWMNKYPEKIELLRRDQQLLLTGNNVKKYLEKKYEKLKQKISPKPTDTTKTQQDTTNDNSVVNTVKDVVDKFKNTDGTPKPTQTVDPSVFNCIKNSRGWGSKLTSKSDEANAYSFLNDVQSEFVFFGDGKFYIQLNSGEKMFGTWKCKGQSSYEIEINNTDFNKKQYFRSETSQWADHQNAAALEENFIKKIVTKHLRSKL
jgi:hypothetical protein